MNLEIYASKLHVSYNEGVEKTITKPKGKWNAVQLNVTRYPPLSHTQSPTYTQKPSCIYIHEHTCVHPNSNTYPSPTKSCKNVYQKSFQ